MEFDSKSWTIYQITTQADGNPRFEIKGELVPLRARSFTERRDLPRRPLVVDEETGDKFTLPEDYILLIDAKIGRLVKKEIIEISKN